MNATLEVVWYSDYINQMGLTIVSVDCFDYIDFKDKRIIILEIHIIKELQK